jgi:hypothetical protein
MSALKRMWWYLLFCLEGHHDESSTAVRELELVAMGLISEGARCCVRPSRTRLKSFLSASYVWGGELDLNRGSGASAMLNAQASEAGITNLAKLQSKLSQGECELAELFARFPEPYF